MQGGTAQLKVWAEAPPVASDEDQRPRGAASTKPIPLPSPPRSLVAASGGQARYVHGVQ